MRLGFDPRGLCNCLQPGLGGGASAPRSAGFGRAPDHGCLHDLFMRLGWTASGRTCSLVGEVAAGATLQSLSTGSQLVETESLFVRDVIPIRVRAG